MLDLIVVDGPVLIDRAIGAGGVEMNLVQVGLLAATGAGMVAVPIKWPEYYTCANRDLAAAGA